MAVTAAKKHATGGVPSPSPTALRVMGASRRSLVRSKPSSAPSSASACIPASAVHSKAPLTPTTGAATTCTASMSASLLSSSPPPCALKMRASPSCQTRQSARQAAAAAAAARIPESDRLGDTSPSTSSNATPSSIDFGDPISTTEAVDLTTMEYPQPESQEVSTQTPYPCIDDLPDIVDSTPEDTDNTQDESADELPCQDLVPYETDATPLIPCGDSPVLSAGHVPPPCMYMGLPAAYGMDVPAVQPITQVGSVPLNLSVNLGNGSMTIPACLTGSIQCPVGPPLDMGVSPASPALVNPNLPNYVVQCQGMIQPAGLMVTSVPSFRCPPFLTTSQTVLATETGLTLLPCQPQLAPSPMNTLQSMNPTLSISLLPPSTGTGMVTRSGGRPIAPAVGVHAAFCGAEVSAQGKHAAVAGPVLLKRGCAHPQCSPGETVSLCACKTVVPSAVHGNSLRLTPLPDCVPTACISHSHPYRISVSNPIASPSRPVNSNVHCLSVGNSLGSLSSCCLVHEPSLCSQSARTQLAIQRSFGLLSLLPAIMTTQVGHMALLVCYFEICECFHFEQCQL